MPDRQAPTLTITEEQLRSIIHDATKQAVGETFLRLGVEVDDPLEMQKDFQHLREWRVTTQGMRTKAFLAAAGIIVTGLAASAWMGFQHSIGAR
jgi:hypothetical protein